MKHEWNCFITFIKKYHVKSTDVFYWDKAGTWSSLLVWRSRWLRKSSREHFLTRMRSVVPSAKCADGDRPLGLRGHAQLMLAALMAKNFPLMTVHVSWHSEIQQHHVTTSIPLRSEVYRPISQTLIHAVI